MVWDIELDGKAVWCFKRACQRCKHPFKAADFAAGPLWPDKLRDVDSGPSRVVPEPFRFIPLQDFHSNFFDIVMLFDELRPVDLHAVFRLACRPGGEDKPVAQFTGCQAANALLAKGHPLEPAAPCASVVSPLRVRPDFQPPFLQQIEGHATAIIFHCDGRFLPLQVKGDCCPCRIGIIGVLDEFKNRQPVVADELVAKQAEDMGSRLEVGAVSAFHQYSICFSNAARANASRRIVRTGNRYH